ncbi:MAG: anthranilate synthase component I family protein [Candidatus Omnitrophica bacterium]|nr:anthranilate synthase component I family protein [Candidatus Omnitrophota bacterium]
MGKDAPFALRHGPLTVYLQPLAGCPDLRALISGLPPDEPVMWCDSARQHPVTGRWSLLGFAPWLALTARGERIELSTSAATHVWRAHPLEALRQVLRRYRAPAPPAGRGTPHGRPACAAPISSRLGAAGRAIGLMGFLSYDLNRWIERLPPPQEGGSPVPEMQWFGMRIVVLVDHVEKRSWLLSVADPHSPPPAARRQALEALERVSGRLAAQRDGAEGGAEAPCFPGVEATSTQAEFEAMAARALEHIRAGDIFQANVSQRFTATWPGRPLALYAALRRVNPSPFACFLSCGDLAVVSCSPERLVRVQEGRIDTRPIAGTRPRGASPTEDALNSLDLLLSDKERAEHIMLVDLARNDLGRVCETGTVAVSDLMTLEEYSHVIHIVSDVSGWLCRGADAVDVIRAVFPGGTITGCPKVRCMQILRALEPVPRGLYTGSLGYLGFDGTMDLNIAIRTMVLQGSRLSFHVGAGIVADSDPGREYRETLDKAGALLAALRSAGGTAPTASDAASR